MADDPLGLGVDWKGLADLDPYGEEVAGFLCLGQALAHRLSTPRGGLFYDTSYGKDLRAYLEEGLTPERLAALPSEVSAECEKDERVESATAEVSFNTLTEKLTVKIRVVTAAGPFTLILDVSKLTVELLRIE